MCLFFPLGAFKIFSLSLVLSSFAMMWLGVDFFLFILFGCPGLLFFILFKNLFIYLFIFGLCWVFVAVRGLSLVVASRAYSSLRCMGFSLQWLLLLRSMGCRRAGFSSCGVWTQ